jgi:hypothetical protein
MKKLLLAALSLGALATTAHAQKEAKPGEPPITARTRASAGPMSETQRAVRFDHVDLAIEVFP